VLALAAVNLGLRLDREMVDVWDESLYATSALEMWRSGNWLVTTFQGAIDHYNSKPPLFVWLVAAMFGALGVNLWSLRLVSAAAAGLTIGLVWWWTRGVAGARAARLAALGLATTYPFLYVHAARTANPDALLTLLVTSATVLVWTGGGRLRPFLLGPVTAAAFMLKGPGIVAPFAVLGAAEWRAARLEAGGQARWWTWHAAGGLAGALIPTWWAIERWQFDGTLFLGRMIGYDLIARAASPLEGHDESAWFYLVALTRYAYEWVVVAAVAVALAPGWLAQGWRWLAATATERRRLTVAAWLVATVGIPTLLPTKLAWYLNPLYPGLAVVVALAVEHSWQAAPPRGWRRAVLAVTIAICLVAVETRLWLRSNRLDLDRSAQGLLLAQAATIRGHRVFARTCPQPEWFLAAAAGSRCLVAPDLAAFESRASSGDFWLDRHDAAPAGLARVDVNRRASLHRRP
jgi:4-amino-4-deoxy-L-arabinose transferase-like glycosyltransferase